MHKLLIAALLILFAASAAATPDDHALHQINSTHWYFETTQNELSDGTYEYQAFANNISSDYREVTVATAPTVTFLSQTPVAIYQNSTGTFNTTWGISHAATGLNNTSVSLIWSVYDTITGSHNHSIRPPSNDKAASAGTYGNILRGDNRNDTLHFETNITITGGDTYSWSGCDDQCTRVSIVPVNSTYTRIYVNSTFAAMLGNMYYLDRTDQQNATMTGQKIYKNHPLLMKIWDLEKIKGRSDHIIVGYADTHMPTSSTHIVSIYYLNSSYDPAGAVDPLDSPYGAYITSHNAATWVDYVHTIRNSTYAKLFEINESSLPIDVDPTGYLYFTSTESSQLKAFCVNISDGATITNRSFADTETLWTGTTAPLTLESYTPNIFISWRNTDRQFQTKLYAADNNDVWGNSTLHTSNIEVSKFAPTIPAVSHFDFNGSTDYDMNQTYSGNITIGVGVATDPDGGSVTHNLTLHYANETFITTINNTFTDADRTNLNAYINFNTTPYYSETEEYTLKVVATDDEGATTESWLSTNFTLGTHQISNLHTTTLVYDHIVWEWTNPDHYDTIMVYIDNVWRQNTTGTSYSASGLAQTTPYTIKLITVYAGEESDPVTDTQITPAEQGGGGGGGGDTPTPTPSPTATATPTATPLPDENVTENETIIIEPIPDITEEIVMNDTISATVWHVSFDKHAVFVPQHANIIACTAIPPYACRYYEDQKKFEIGIDGESPNPVFTADQWVTFITRDGKRISQRVHTKVYNPLFYFTTPAISGSVGDFLRYFVHGDEYAVTGIRAWWLVLLVIGGIGYHWRRKKNE